ncbi:coiled-coil domain-containing protein [Sinomicrobium sp.]
MDVGQLKGSVVINFGSVREAEKAIKALQGTFNKVADDSKKLIKAADDLAKSQNAQAQAAKELAKSNTQLASTANRVDAAEKARIKAHATAEKNLVALARAERDNLNVTEVTQSALSAARKATEDYRNAVDKLGAGSVEATRAQVRMKAAVDDAKNTIKDSNNNTKNQIAAYRQLVPEVNAASKATRDQTATQTRLLKAHTQVEQAEKQLLVMKRNTAAETRAGIDALMRATMAVRSYKAMASGAKVSNIALTASYERMQQELIKASVATTGLNSATANTRSWFRSSRAAASQFGLQLQDVAVQAQMGTDALVILGQQGSQLLGFFGAAGAMAGAVLAIGSALAYVVSNSKVAKDGAKALRDVVDDLGGSFESTSEGALVLSESILKLAEVSEGAARLELKRQYVEAQREINNTGETLQALLGDQESFFTAGITQIKRLTDAGMEAEEIYNRLSGSVSNSSSGVQTALSAISAAAEEATEKFGLAEEEALSLFSSVAKVQSEANEGSLQGLIDTLNHLEKNASGANDEFTLFAAELSSVATAAVQAIRKGEDVQGVLDNLPESLKRARKALEDSGRASRAASDAFKRLADRLDKLEKGSKAADTVKREWEMLKQLKDEYGDITEETRLYREQVALLNRLYADTGNEEYLRILERLNKSKEKLGKTTKTAADEATAYIARLKEEAETVSLSEQALVRYRIEKLAAKDATIQNAQALIEEGQAYVSTVQAAEDRIKQMEEEKKRREQLLDQMQKDYQKRQQFMQGGEVSHIMTQAIQLKSAGVDEAAIKDFMARQNKIINESAREVSSSPFGDIETLDLELAQREQRLIEYFGREKAMTTEHWKALQENAEQVKPLLQVADWAQTTGKALGYMGNIMSQATTALETMGRKGSKEWKAFAMAQATVNYAMAVMNAWVMATEAGKMAGPAGPAVTAAVGGTMTALLSATFGAQIAQIQSSNYATGGLVRGPGTGTSDDIPANLSNGEYVLRADAVRKIGVANLNAMNQGRMANFSSGGLVGGGSAGGGSGTTIVVNDNRSGGAPVQTRETTDQYGNSRIELLIEDVVRNGMSRGTFDREMRGNFGIQRPGRRV